MHITIRDSSEYKNKYMLPLYLKRFSGLKICEFIQVYKNIEYIYIYEKEQ